MALALWASGCDGRGSFVQFEVRDWAPRFGGDFSNGDFIAAGQRVSASRVVLVDAEWPGLDCEHLAPAPDDTDFLQCGRLYARPPGGERWVEVKTPPPPARFLGQDRDGARYFTEPGWLWVQPPEATELQRVAVDASFGEPVMHAFGVVVFTTGRSPSSAQAIELERFTAGTSRTYRQQAFSEPFVSRLIDGEGNFFVLTPEGLDRLSPDGARRDVAWFKFPSTNQVFDLLGVGSDGRLFALSTAKTNLTGADTRADNEVPIEALMAMAPGDREWTQVSEPLSTPESRSIGYGLEKPYDARPGRDGSWWLSKCVANCDPNGANNAHQSYVWQWRRPGTEKTSPLAKKVTLWRGQSVRLHLPKYGDLKTWKLAALPADLGLSELESSPQALVLSASRTARLGTHAVTVTNPGGAAETFEVELKGLDALPLESPRRITFTRFDVPSSGSRTIWLDVDGVVHFRDASGTSTEVPGLPAAQSVEGEYVHAVDGRVFALSGSTFAQTVIEVHELAMPAAHSLHDGAALLANGDVYLLLATARPPMRVLQGAVSISSRQTRNVQLAGRLNTEVRALDAQGAETTLSHEQLMDVPLVAPSTTWRAVARLGVGETAVGHDGRLVNGQIRFGTSALKSFDSIRRRAGSLGSDTFDDDFPLVVTAAGEAWVVSTASLFAIPLPEGRTAEVMIAGGAGQVVWLDDGSVLDIPAPDLQANTWSPGTVLELPRLARSSP